MIQIQMIHQHVLYRAKNKKGYFNCTMYDPLGRVIIVKVFSHQMDSKFDMKDSHSTPCPNTFVVSANQITDNAATQAQEIYADQNLYGIEYSFYPPFPLDGASLLRENKHTKEQQNYCTIKWMKSFYFIFNIVQNKVPSCTWHPLIV